MSAPVTFVKKSPQAIYSLRRLGGRGWIRTIEAEKQQIYSLPPLAARELLHIRLCHAVVELVDGFEPPTC